MTHTIHELFETFLCEREFIQKAQPETLRGYRELFKLFSQLTPSLALESVTPVTVVHFFRALQERRRLVGKSHVKKGVKPSTVATYAGKLNTFFSWLEARKYIPENPFRTIPLPSVTYTDKKFLHRHHIEKILTAIHMHSGTSFLFKRNLVIFYLLLFCGLRKGELLQLQVRDIDMERKLITIRAGVLPSHHQIIV